MREGRALRRAAWRELWQAALLAIGCAVVLAYASATGIRPEAMWIGLWLVPAALLCGVACGRATPRMLAFMLARPVRRESMLMSRMVVGASVLGVAWAIVSVSIAVRDPHVGAGFDGLLVAGVLLVAMICGVLGATATDREPLALGIATLAFFAVPMVPLFAAEALDVGLDRVTASHPMTLALLLVGALIGLGRAVVLAWREHLPLRDRWMARCLVTRSAGAWVIVQPICLFAVWNSASPHEASPVAVIGADARGVIVVGGSPRSSDGGTGQWTDSMTVGVEEPLVVVDVTQRSALLGGAPAADIRRAVAAGGRVAVELRQRGRDVCQVEISGPDGSRPIDAQCGPLSLSPSGETLAVAEGGGIIVVDTASLERRAELRRGLRLDMLGWRDEEVVSWCRSDAQFYVGANLVATATTSVTEARLSPGGDRVALRSAPHPRRGWEHPLEAPATISLVSLDTGLVSRLDVGLDVATVVGWLDPVHVAVLGRPRINESQVLRVIDADTSAIVTSVRHFVDAPLNWIAGPPQGPWLVGSVRPLLEAWDSSGDVMWSESASRLELDDHDTHRWAIAGGEVVGIDPRGRWWRHPVPWEVTP